MKHKKINMDTKKTVNDRAPYQPTCQNSDHAKNVLNIIFKDRTNVNIHSQIFEWIAMHPQQEAIEKFQEEFPGLELDFEWSELLDPNRKIPGWEKDIKTDEATALSIALVVIDLCWNLFGQKIKENKKNRWDIDKSSKDYDEMLDIIHYVDFNLLNKALSCAVLSAVGRDSLQHYSNIINRKDISVEERTLMMEAERLTNPNINLIVFSQCLHVIIDCCYVLFKNLD